MVILRKSVPTQVYQAVIRFALVGLLPQVSCCTRRFLLALRALAIPTLCLPTSLPNVLVSFRFTS